MSNNSKCKCGKSRPSINFTGLKPEYCRKCKKPGMIPLYKKKLCKCCKHPSFNLPGLKREYCNKCKKSGMVNVYLHKRSFAINSQPSINKPLKFRFKLDKIKPEDQECIDILADMLMK